MVNYSSQWVVSMSEFQRNIERYMDAGIPIIYVDTLEYDKVERTVESLAKSNRRNLIRWWQHGTSIDEYDGESTTLLTSYKLEQILELLTKDPWLEQVKRGIVLLEDVHFFLSEEKVIGHLRELSYRMKRGDMGDCTIIMAAPLERIPKELETYITIVNLEYLQEHEIRELVIDLLEEYGADIPDNKELLEGFVMLLKGLSETEIRNVISLVLTSNNEIDKNDIFLVMKFKQQMVQKSGILEMIVVRECMEDIGGLRGLKDWIEQKWNVVRQLKKAIDFGVDIPKGVLIAGMPGCGKSMAAKAIAAAFQMPLLRMDMGRLMGKYVGESESNMRRALRLTEATSPCVLWIDELEKAFAGIKAGGGGSEVTTRLFGSFLTWMQEKKDNFAFVVATANKISDLPPELLRKGRFDEIFYVDFPNKEERKEIFKKHIQKRRREDIKNIDLEVLANKTDRYSGADIEGVVKEAVESAFVSGQESLSTKNVIDAIDNTHPISETMKDSIEQMEKDYKDKMFRNASQKRR